MTQYIQEPKTLRILRLSEVKNKTGMACSSIYSMIANTTFPSPIKLSKRSVGWLETEIDQWIAERVNGSRPQGGNK